MNSHLKPYQFSQKGDVPLSKVVIGTRYADDVLNALNKIDDKQQYIRDAVEKRLMEDGLIQGNKNGLANGDIAIAHTNGTAFYVFLCEVGQKTVKVFDPRLTTGGKFRTGARFDLATGVRRTQKETSDFIEFLSRDEQQPLTPLAASLKAKNPYTSDKEAAHWEDGLMHGLVGSPRKVFISMHATFEQIYEEGFSLGEANAFPLGE